MSKGKLFIEDYGRLYEPSEDSYLLKETVTSYLKNIPEFRLKSLRALDMGTGSGIQTINLLNNGLIKENILATDINPNSIEIVSRLGVKFIVSNLFSSIKDEFDLIIFNPPYLPYDKYDKSSDTCGGRRGDEIILRFIKDLSSHLSDDGVCFLLLSSFTPKTRIKNCLMKNSLIWSKASESKLFFEKLFVLKIQKVINSY